ncbi:hypothetical protein [Curtobacterium sp. MCBD17_040]|uniref:hypothetical protein n=1 Tax=Curtobacterium sp. MCBD17_040 TaxID=2175674 RepID=UPI0024DF69FD|nr:hypothetical protein [Curtobacterium sp. MCBD17_040]WIB65452.1 hypothetical protein DEI94_18950 [Curtobacterium sp. MCBD17_040]
MAVTASAAANLVAPTVTVDIPKGSVKGSGHLAVVPALTDSGVAVFSIRLTGATLTGPMTLTFPHARTKDSAKPFIAYSEARTGALTPVSNIKVTSAGAVVSTTHFSFWLVSWASDVINGIKQVIQTVLAKTQAAGPPTCASEDKARAGGLTVTSGSGNSVYWCVGLNAAGQTEVKVTNPRNFPVVMDSTPGLTLENPDPEWVAAIKRFTGGAPARHPGDTVYVVNAGETESFVLTGTTAQTIHVEPSELGFFVQGLVLAAQMVVLLVTHKPLGVAKELPSKAPNAAVAFYRYVAANAECAVPEGKLLLGSKLDNIADGMKAVATGLEAAAECVVPSLKVSNLIAQGASTLTTLFSTVVDAVTLVLNAPVEIVESIAGYDVTLTPPLPQWQQCRKPTETLSEAYRAADATLTICTKGAGDSTSVAPQRAYFTSSVYGNHTIEDWGYQGDGDCGSWDNSDTNTVCVGYTQQPGSNAMEMEVFTPATTGIVNIPVLQTYPPMQ